MNNATISTNFQTISVRQLGRDLKISYRNAQLLVDTGDIASVRVGARRRVAVSEIARWLHGASAAAVR